MMSRESTPARAPTAQSATSLCEQVDRMLGMCASAFSHLLQGARKQGNPELAEDLLSESQRLRTVDPDVRRALRELSSSNPVAAAWIGAEVFRVGDILLGSRCSLPA